MKYIYFGIAARATDGLVHWLHRQEATSSTDNWWNWPDVLEHALLGYAVSLRAVCEPSSFRSRRWVAHADRVHPRYVTCVSCLHHIAAL